jgi:hypothetical protein
MSEADLPTMWPAAKEALLIRPIVRLGTRLQRPTRCLSTVPIGAVLALPDGRL